MTSAKSKFALLVMAFVASAGVRASSGNPVGKLDWRIPGEELIYYSCGCADSCWVAEVRSIKRPRIVKAILRCDCEKLLFSQADAKVRIVSENCSEFDSMEKFKLIPKQMKQLRESSQKELRQ